MFHSATFNLNIRMYKRPLTAIVLFLYALILFQVMVLKDLPTIHIGHLRFRFSGTHTGTANFVPFRTIKLYMRGAGGLVIAGVNLLGNVLLLVPIGFLFPILFPGTGWRRSLMIGLASGLAIEGLQTMLQVGIFDIDDVILNACGVLVGHGCWLLYQRYRQHRVMPE